MQELLFIAVVPPADIRVKVTALKNEIAEKYSSSHALKSPPHITLHMPFKFKQAKREKLETKLFETIGKFSPFRVKLSGFDVFEPRVIFVQPEPNDKLEELHNLVKKAMKQLNVFNSDYKNRPFHPHMTVAFRDLKKPDFYEAWKDFSQRQFVDEFEVSSISLLKHDGKIWTLEKEFSF